MNDWFKPPDHKASAARRRALAVARRRIEERNYSGVLAPYVCVIDEFAAKGYTARQIAEGLDQNDVTTGYGNGGVERLTAAVRYVLKRHSRKRGLYRPPKVATARWQVWTPEMQHEELEYEQCEYGGEHARKT